MNVLGDLLRIKKFRQDKAEMEVSHARDAVDKATCALDEACSSLEALRLSSDERERALYADLCSRAVRLADLDEVKFQVDRMREAIEAQQESVQQALEAREAAVERLAQARTDYREATRKREKFTELETVFGLERMSEAARAEDLEMEEVPVKRPADPDALGEQFAEATA
jgi:type III secretion protein O